MTRSEALDICKKELRRHEGGSKAYLSILSDLQELSEYRECYEEDEDNDKAYSVGSHDYKAVSTIIEVINDNCDADGEARIPMKLYHMANVSDGGWYIECLIKSDEPRLEKHLNYIFGTENNTNH